MPLNDLVIDTDEIAEEAIEKVVKGYLRYDPKVAKSGGNGIILNKNFKKLSIKQMIIVYLLGVKGWDYIKDGPKSKDIDTTSGKIAECLNIRSNTVRARLKEIKDDFLVSVTKEGNYFINSHKINDITDIIPASNTLPASPASTKLASPKKSIGKSGTKNKSTSSKAEKKKKKSTKKKKTIIITLVEGGFFDEPKLIADILEKHRALGKMVKRGTLSSSLLRYVRQRVLLREKIEVKGKKKKQWAYYVKSGKSEK